MKTGSSRTGSLKHYICVPLRIAQRLLYNCFNMCFCFLKIADINSVENNKKKKTKTIDLFDRKSKSPKKFSKVKLVQKLKKVKNWKWGQTQSLWKRKLGNLINTWTLKKSPISNLINFIIYLWQNEQTIIYSCESEII